MEVTVKVLMNQKSIDEAKQKNQTLQQERTKNLGVSKHQRPEVEADVAIPDEDIQEKPMLIDAFEIELATISQNEMISIIWKGKGFELVNDAKVWKKISEAVNLREDAKRKELQPKN